MSSSLRPRSARFWKLNSIFLNLSTFILKIPIGFILGSVCSEIFIVCPPSSDNGRMNTIRKVNASAGIQWLRGSVTLLQRAPLALAGLGVLWGTCIWLLSALALWVPVLNLPLQLLLFLIGPLFMGGMLWALREVERGQPAKPAHLLQGLSNGRLPQLLVTLLPQLLAVIVLYMLMWLFMGEEGLQQIASVITQLDELGRAGGEPDPAQVQALVSSLPSAQIALWLLSVLLICTLTGVLLFIMLPQVMFEPVSGWQALRRSVHASSHNLAAMLVFLLLLGVVLGVVYFAALIVMLVLMAVLGQALALVLTQIGLMAVLMPLIAGAMYMAWKQMLAQPGETGTPPPLVNHVFEA